MTNGTNHPCISKSTCFSIGNAAVAIENPAAEPGIGIPAAYQPFITDRDPDIRIVLDLGRPDLSAYDKIFDSPPIWSLHRRNGKRVFSIFDRMGARSHYFCLFDGKNYAEIRFAPQFARPLDPFCGPALELLTVERFSSGTGCLLHGCGVSLQNRGILFAGPSGAGKSTMLRLWAGKKDTLILSDDRTIARNSGDKLRIYGTPWHGKAQAGRPDGADLAGIFFLKHGVANRMRGLSTVEAVSRLLTCSFPPLWDSSGMAATVDFFEFVSRNTPCYELEFVPDASVVDFVQRWANR